MMAEQFYREILCKIKGGYTPRMVYNRAKRYNLRDTLGEISYWTGLPLEKAEEFEFIRGRK